MKNKLVKEDYISNKEIKKGDIYHRIYQVVSDPVFTENGAEWKLYHKHWKTELKLTRPDPEVFLRMDKPAQQEVISAIHYFIGNLSLNPYIAGFYDSRRIGGSPALLSEWPDRGTLRQCIDDGTLYHGSEAEVSERLNRIAVQTARALQFVNSEGLSHRAAAPENVLITDYWNAKLSLTDLRTLARKQAPESEDITDWALTVLEMYLGKKKWSSPVEASDNYMEYTKEFRCGISEKLSKMLCLGLANSYPELPLLLHDFRHVFLELGLPINEDFPSERGGYRNNFALRMIDNGNWDQALDVLEDAVSLETSGTNPAEKNLEALKKYIPCLGKPLDEMPEEFFTEQFELYT